MALMLAPHAAWSGCDLSRWGLSANETGPLATWKITGIGVAARNGDDITTCDVSLMTNFYQLFSSASSFNQDISGWDVSNVTDFSLMFRFATSFNQDISGWDTSSATNMDSMFRGATAFDQNIFPWDVGSVSNFDDMFTDATAMHATYSSRAGFGNTPTSSAFGADIIAPIAPTVSTSNGTTLSGTAEAGSTVTVYAADGTTVLATTTADGSGNWSLANPLADGQTGTVTATDSAGNVSTATAIAAVDAGTPTVAIQNAPSSVNSTAAFSVTFEFSEDVTGFGVGDITVVNGAAGNFAATDGNTYTADITPDGNGDITIDVAANTAQDAAGNNNQAATQVRVTTDGTPPTVTITGPTDVVTEDFTVTFTFSEDVTGFTADDVMVTNGTKGAFAEPTSGSVYTLVVTPDLGTTVSVSVAADKANDPAGNGNEASNVFEVQAGSPASEFEKYREDIQQVIVDEALRSLRSTLFANRRMTQSARDRFIELRQEQYRGEQVTRALIPLDLNGNFTVSESGLSTAGNFFQQVGNEEGTYRRLFFGDFDVQHDNDTDSTTATLTGRVAWEQMTSEQTMLGYFIGGELATSTIGGSFEGDQDRIGVTAGGYVVHELAEQVYFDGFLSYGIGRNNLDMANDVLALTSDYTTRTATMGAAVSGVYEYGQYEFRPELAFSYGKTWIGNVGFTGRAYGLVDDALSLDAGNVSIANLTLRPEVIWALDADTVADSNSQLSFAPRAICERSIATTRTENCGGGAEIGLSSTSEDGMSNAELRVIVDKVGDSTRSSLVLNFERQF